MINSMTGYGRAQAVLDGKTITVEVRSVNHRYFDCTVKAPRVYGFLEDPVRNALAKTVTRGKIEVYITVDLAQSDSITVSLNKPAAEGYVAALRELKDLYGLRDDISVMSLARFADIFNVKKVEEDAETLTKDVLHVAEVAFAGYNAMRAVEGDKLREDMDNRVLLLQTMVKTVEERSPAAVAEYRKKMEQRIRELLAAAQPDDTRLLTEAALYADRTAVDEETTRLKSHLLQIRSLLSQDIPVGRKLDFLVQELNREANTIGSKANDLEMANVVVDMKSEIEKIREQVQNVE